MEFATRFAPSPTGLLHLGHAFSALTGWRMARAAGGRFVLRIEDIDTTRCRPAFEAAMFEDLAWLGIDWDGPVWRQSERLPVYADALQRLREMGVVYPCFCTRADIAAAGGAPQGPEGPHYPGTCRALSEPELAAKSGTPAWRLDVAKAAALTGPLTWEDTAVGLQTAAPDRLGDIVLARRDIGAAYHLAVVIDDAAQGITDVVRGVDLFEATHVQRLLQALLGLPAPRYHHHALVTGADGKRLAKRDGGSTIAAARAAGEDPAALAERLLARWGGGAA
jgi:glutamyl-Q tRNA(Asp) synthetase